MIQITLPDGSVRRFDQPVGQEDDRVPLLEGDLAGRRLVAVGEDAERDAGRLQGRANGPRGVQDVAVGMPRARVDEPVASRVHVGKEQRDEAAVLRVLAERPVEPAEDGLEVRAGAGERAKVGPGPDHLEGRPEPVPPDVRARFAVSSLHGPLGMWDTAGGDVEAAQTTLSEARALLESYPLQPATKTALTEVADLPPTAVTEMSGRSAINDQREAQRA